MSTTPLTQAADGGAVLKQTLRSLFKPYRVQEPIIAHRNVRMRGQAFVTFPDLDAAKRAKKDVNEFPLYGKPIVRGAQRGESMLSRSN